SIPREQAAAVHEEAWRRLTEREGLLVDGEQFARQMIAAALTGTREERPADKAAQPGGEFLAASLDPVAPAALAQVLGREHPQVIALVLANLRARKAAEVLAALPEDLQPEIAERIADLQSVPEDLLADVGDVLAGPVQGHAREAVRQPRAAHGGDFAGGHGYDGAGPPEGRRAGAGPHRGGGAPPRCRAADHARRARERCRRLARNSHRAPSLAVGDW